MLLARLRNLYNYGDDPATTIGIFVGMHRVRRSIPACYLLHCDAAKKKASAAINSGALRGLREYRVFRDIQVHQENTWAPERHLRSPGLHPKDCVVLKA